MYDDALRWLLTLPDFERTGEFAMRPDLAPMHALLAELGDPHRRRPTVHIAGSKGKGSTGAMVEAVLRASGLRTGHYVSPHLHRYNERIRVDGGPLAPDGFAAALECAHRAIESIAARFPDRRFLAFDALTAAGFVAFRDAGVDVQIIEVGVGGTLDSTNVFLNPPVAAPPHVTAITPISLEHTAILGPTIAAIAEQKGGIIADRCTLVVAPQRESALDVFRRVAGERGARLIEIAQACQVARSAASPDGQRIRLKTPRARYEAQLPLAGRHQLENAATAVVAAEEIAAAMGRDLTTADVSRGLASLHWPGRLEVLRRRPLVVVDGAHNGDSAKRMLAALREDFGLARATFLFGTLSGKDIPAMTEALAPLADAVYVAPWPHARAAEPRDLAESLRSRDLPALVAPSLAGAFESALAHAGERGAVVAFGALAFVAAVREYVLGIESDMIRLTFPNRSTAAGARDGERT